MSMRFFAWFGAALLVVGGCGSGWWDAPALRELARNPAQFDIGAPVDVRGFLIRPVRSVTFVCNEISHTVPPKATGPFCVEVQRPGVNTIQGFRHKGRTTWVPTIISLSCVVSAYRPGPVRPERLTLSCHVVND